MMYVNITIVEVKDVYILLFRIICWLLTTLLPDLHSPILGRFAIVANRSTVALCSSQIDILEYDISKMKCDGHGSAVIVTIDCEAPWNRAVLSTLFAVQRGDLTYPNVLLRHAHSRYGICFGSHGGFPAQAHVQFHIHVSSLLKLELINEQLQLSKNDKNDKTTEALLHVLTAERGGITLDLFPNGPFASAGKPRPGESAIYYDFLVTNAAECEIFIEQPDGSVSSLVKSILPSRQMINGGKDVKPWQTRHNVPGDIDGPFAVVPHKKARYLVTPAGAVVRMVGAAGKAEPKLVAVYDKSKVLAVVHDTDEEVRYAFTATHFFEVAEPVVLKPHAVKKFDTSNGAAGLETAFHCARAVRGLPPVPFPPPPK